MKYEWDAEKAKANFKKHHVSFELAITIFDDPLHLSVVDRPSSSKEERWVTIGLAADQSTLIVVHTYFLRINDEVIRIISARKATKSERKQYEEGI